MSARRLPQSNHFTYVGQIAGQKVAGSVVALPEKQWGTEAGLRALFRALHKRTGLSEELMERNAAVVWTHLRLKLRRAGP